MTVLKSLLAASKQKPQAAGETRQDFCLRLLKGIHSLGDADWEDLPEDAKNWFNDACDLKATSKVGPWAFTPIEGEVKEEEEEEEEAPAKRRPGKVEAATAATTTAIDVEDLKVKMVVKITKKNGKDITGTVVEVDDAVVVLKMGDDSEEEVSVGRIESIEKMTTPRAAKTEEPEADPVKVGAVVKVTTKRGKVYTGKIVELDEELVVLKTEDGEEELDRSRVETIELVAGKSKPTPTETQAPRKRAAEEELNNNKDEKPKRSSNPAGVSVGGRIREIMCADMDVSAADVGAALKKEGLEFRDTSLSMIYKDTTTVFALLKAAKKIK